MTYRYRTWDTRRTLWCSGSFNGELSRLDEVVAPDLWKLPRDIAGTLRRRFYSDLTRSKNWDEKHAAQDTLAAETDAFMRERLNVAFDDYELADKAKALAAACERMQTLDAMQEWARAIGITPPEPGKPRERTRLSCIKRMRDAKWWRRALRSQWTRHAESHLRAIGIVQKRRQVYASDHMVRCRRGRQRRNNEILKNLLAVSDAGDQLELFELAKGSQSNPAVRRAELMVRLRGFEECAKEAGHVADFFTLTCPSAFHATKADGSRNELFEGHTPREAQRWLSSMWAKARAKLARRSVLFYGFRIAEPHHDGTPHWHMVLFARPADRETLRTVCREVWLSEYHGEHGARIHRIKVQSIDSHKGSAAGYLAKYVAKNIDGFEVGTDYETATPASESAERVRAWASAHGIRQFQQIGGPTVGLWREVRRVREVCAIHPIEAIRVEADAGNYSGFIRANGGIDRGRSGHVAVWSERSGEINAYDECRTAEPVGLVSAAGRIRTRLKVWRIQRKAEGGAGTSAQRLKAGAVLLPSLGPVSITVRSEKSVPARPVERQHASSSIRGPPWLN